MMEEQLLDLLRATQLAAAQPRMTAELQLKQLYTSPQLPAAFVNIASHHDLPLADRLSALLALKAFVNAAWSPTLEDFAGHVLVDDQSKEAIRNHLLNLIYAGHIESKITSNTAAVVAIIARADYPDQWPDLLNSLLRQIPQSNDDQTQAILVVLGELIGEGLDEDAFYQYAAPLLEALRKIAANSATRLMVRALAVHTVESCFDFLENLKDRAGGTVQDFGRNVCSSWAPLFVDVIKQPMPPFPSASEEEDPKNPPIASTWRGCVAFKTQIAVLLNRIQSTFPDVLDTETLFSATWDALQVQGPHYYSSFVDGGRQGSLINQYQLPYTLDMLIVEEIDYLQSLLEAPQVKHKLDGMRDIEGAKENSAADTWLTSILTTLLAFSSITQENEEMWDIDVNTFLSEETLFEVGSSPRSVCAGFVWKLSELFPAQTLQSLLGHSRRVWSDASTSWKQREAALYLLQQIAEEHKSEERDADGQAVALGVDLVQSERNNNHAFLRARYHAAMAPILAAWRAGGNINDEIILNYAQHSIESINTDSSPIVKASCIRVAHDYLTSLPSPLGTQLQDPVVNAVARFLDTQDLNGMEDDNDLIDIILQTLRDAVFANPATSLEHNALHVLLNMVKAGTATHGRSSTLIEEAFETAAEGLTKQGPEAYAALCQKVLPSLISSLDVENLAVEESNGSLEVATTLLETLAREATAALPSGFASATLPRLCRLIFSDAPFYLVQSATLTVKYMLNNDPQQVFDYVDSNLNKTGLEICFMVLGHLLGPQTDDAAAAEVGELAVTVIEKADPAALGASMHELLRIMASRLALAEHLGLIQTLSLVFARLSQFNASDMVDFLANTQPETVHETALTVVLRKWLENSVHFSGFQAIRENVQALISVYRLHDARVAAVEVNGDLIPDATTRIKTRSMAKNAPIRYTRVSAQLKIVKLLVGELLPYGQPSSATDGLKSPGLGPAVSGRHSGPNASGADEDDEWESEDDDDGGDAVGFGGNAKSADEATQKALIAFFHAEGADPQFQTLYGELAEDERRKCVQAVEGWAAYENQRQLLEQRV